MISITPWILAPALIMIHEFRYLQNGGRGELNVYDRFENPDDECFDAEGEVVLGESRRRMEGEEDSGNASGARLDCRRVDLAIRASMRSCASCGERFDASVIPFHPERKEKGI